MTIPNKPSARTILIGLAALAVGLVVLVLGGGWLVRRKLGQDMVVATSMPLPPEMKEPRVLVAEETFSKRPFAGLKGLGLVTDMRPVGGDLVLAGAGGTLRADASGRAKGDLLRYPVNYVDRVEIVPLKNGADYDLLAVASVVSGPALLDRSGNILWKSAKSPLSAAAGDLDGSGVPSIALGYNGAEGVELLDQNGKSLWKVPAGNPWHMEIAPTEPGGPARLLYSGAKGDIAIRDAAGKIVRKPATGASDGYIDYFVPLRWPDSSGKPAFLFGAKNGFFVRDAGGNILGSLSAPSPSTDVKDPRIVAACRVAFKGPGREYLALSVRPDAYFERALLYIYAPDGHVVYAELLAHPAGALLAIPRPGRPGAQTLLVGEKDEVSAYDL